MHHVGLARVGHESREREDDTAAADRTERLQPDPRAELRLELPARIDRRHHVTHARTVPGRELQNDPLRSPAVAVAEHVEDANHPGTPIPAPLLPICIKAKLDASRRSPSGSVASARGLLTLGQPMTAQGKIPMAKSRSVTHEEAPATSGLFNAFLLLAVACMVLAAIAGS